MTELIGGLFLLAFLSAAFFMLGNVLFSSRVRERRRRSVEVSLQKIEQEKIRQANEERYIMSNPDENTNDWEVHKKRMLQHRSSQYKGCYYYVGPRGGWYYINSNGRRTYV